MLSIYCINITIQKILQCSNMLWTHLPPETVDWEVSLVYGVVQWRLADCCQLNSMWCVSLCPYEYSGDYRISHSHKVPARSLLGCLFRKVTTETLKQPNLSPIWGSVCPQIGGRFLFSYYIRQRVSRMIKGWEHLTHEERHVESWDCLSWKRESSGGSHE